MRDERTEEGKNPKTRIHQRRNHMPIKVTPDRLPVHKQYHVAIGRPLIEVVDAQLSTLGIIHLQVVRLERVVDQAFESLIGCALVFHVSVVLRFSVMGPAANILVRG